MQHLGKPQVDVIRALSQLVQSRHSPRMRQPGRPQMDVICLRVVGADPLRSRLCHRQTSDAGDPHLDLVRHVAYGLLPAWKTHPPSLRKRTVTSQRRGCLFSTGTVTSLSHRCLMATTEPSSATVTAPEVPADAAEPTQLAVLLRERNWHRYGCSESSTRRPRDRSTARLPPALRAVPSGTDG